MIDIIYIRVSTELQNPENQLKDCEKLAPIGATVYEERQSAWKDDIKKRPIFSNIKDMILKGNVKSLTVWDLDRIYRKRLMTVDFIKLCKFKGVIIRSYRQTWLNDIEKMPSPWNEIIYEQIIQIFGWIAEEESNKKSERVKIAFQNHKGKKWGRKALPQRVINKVIELNKAGLSIRKISDSEDLYYYDKNKNMQKVSKSAVHKILMENK